MDNDIFLKAVLPYIEQNVPHGASKLHQMVSWFRVFKELLDVNWTSKLLYVCLVLSDEECWEETEYGIKLNRNMVAKNMIDNRSRRGESNPFDIYERYRIACWCCLEGDVAALLRQCLGNGIASCDSLKEVVKSTGDGRGGMVKYWTYVASGKIYRLPIGSNKHLYVYGLRVALRTRRIRVEAVEFFSNKIERLPEEVLSDQQKDEIFMKSAVYAANEPCNFYPEVFEFCFSRICPDKYLELLKLDNDKNRCHNTLITLLNAFRFDQFRILLDCLHPLQVSICEYNTWLIIIGKCINRDNQDACITLFMHLWNNEGFSVHCDHALRCITGDSWFSSDGLLSTFIYKNYLEPVWTILDKCAQNQIKEFMNSDVANYLQSELRDRKDKNSLNKFLSYAVDHSVNIR